MVNPGSFHGSRKAFLIGEKPAYAVGVREGYAADALATIQRRYFKRYPVDLPDEDEPTSEHLDSVDDDKPEPEQCAPDMDLLGKEAFDVAMKEVEKRRKLVTFRKAIKRWLAYQYMKDNDIDPKESGATNPYRILLHQLTGVRIPKPRLRSAANVWRKTHRKLIDDEVARRMGIVEDTGSRRKDLVAIRDKVAREMFSQLPEVDRNQWSDQAKEEHEVALKTWQAESDKKPSTESAARQRCIQGLTRFIQPILDSVVEATGWKVSLIAGGPEPADDGRLNVISIHSGTTPGDVQMNFGAAERVRYKKYFVPAFGAFLQKCYTVEECHARALPKEQGHQKLSGLDLDEDGVNFDSLYTFDTSISDWDNESTVVSSVSLHPKSSAPIPVPTSTPLPRSLSPRGLSHGSPHLPTARQPSVPRSSTPSQLLPPSLAPSSVRLPSVPRSSPPLQSPPRSPTHSGAAVCQSPILPLPRPPQPRNPSLVHETTVESQPPVPVVLQSHPASSSRSSGVPPHPTIAMSFVSFPDDTPALPRSTSNGRTANVDKPEKESVSVSGAHSTSKRTRSESTNISKEPSPPAKRRCHVATNTPPTQAAMPNLRPRQLRSAARRISPLSIPTKNRHRAPGSNVNAASPSNSQKSTSSTFDSQVTSPLISQRSSTLVSTPSPVEEPNNPVWFDNAKTMFEGQVLGDEWAKLVNVWSLFEKQAGYAGENKLASKHRPEAVAQWIKRKRVPNWRPVINLTAYEEDFLLWWTSLQPAWRVVNGSIMLESLEGDWSILDRPGVNGIVSVLAALFFWGSYIVQVKDDKEMWSSVVQDCTHALCHLV